MTTPNEDSIEAIGCELLVREGGSQVVIMSIVAPHYREFDEVKQERLNRVMRLWCTKEALTKEMFNGNEGRAPRTNAQLKAMKTFKHRLYGFERDVGGYRTFIIVDYDPAKKRDAADPNILKRAKGRVDTLGRGK